MTELRPGEPIRAAVHLEKERWSWYRRFTTRPREDAYRDRYIDANDILHFESYSQNCDWQIGEDGNYVLVKEPLMICVMDKGLMPAVYFKKLISRRCKPVKTVSNYEKRKAVSTSEDVE